MTSADDALLALRLFASAPKRFGGLWIRGDGARLVARLRDWLPIRKLPLSIDDDRLVGGVDLGASLAAGRPVRSRGLLDEARDEVLLVQGAERMRETLAGRLAQAMDDGGPALVLIDDGVGEEQPPLALTDRIAFRIEIDSGAPIPTIDCAPQDCGLADAGDEQLVALAGVAAALGVESLRALHFALHAARAHASLNGRAALADEDVIAATRLVLAPRATRMPAEQEQAAEQPEQQTASAEVPLEDVVLAAIRPQLTAELIAACVARSRGRGAGRGQGARKRARTHGRPIGARAGTPAGGLRLALVDTLRAAAPWQSVRGRGQGTVRLRKDDLRVRRFEDRETVLTVFAVDASGSAAFARLAEAKGAVELMLERAYARRAEVALIAFRGSGAELVLPPTRSLTRARKLLADMPGGGATPLAGGLNAARELAEAGRMRGRTAQLIVLTDGRGNVAASGEQSRGKGAVDALTAARRIAGVGIAATVLDISARAQPEAAALADAMRARLVHLPRADAAALAAAVA